MEKVMTIKEAAEYLRCHDSTVYRMLKNGTLRGFKLGSDWRFTQESLDEQIKEWQSQGKVETK